MKKIYFLLITLLITSLSFGQVLVAEGFSYPDGALVPNGGWTQNTGTSGTFLVSSGQAIVDHNSSEDVRRSYTAVPGTVYFAFDFSVDDLGAPHTGTDNEYFAHLAFKTRIDIVPPTGSGDFSVGLSAASSTAAIVWASDLTYGQTYRLVAGFDQDTGTAQLWIDPVTSTSTSISDTASAAIVDTVDFRQSGSTEDETIRIDDLMVGQAFDDVLVFVPPTDPTLNLSDGPANGSTNIVDPETPSNATIDFTTTNFVMSTDTGGGTGTGGDGFIKWTVENTVGNVFVNGGNIFTSNDGFEYPVTGLLNGETYFFRSELVNNGGDPLSTAVVYSVTITIGTYIDVANLAALRASTVDPGLYYRVTGPVINTNRDADTDGQTLHFQDGTAGIKVFDPEYEVQTVYNRGDGVTNIRGRLFSVNDVLHFVPTFDDWGEPTSAANPSIPDVTIATLITDWEMYESELVNINGVAFADAGGTFVEAAGDIGNYDISDVSGGPIVFRTDFGTANYIGQTIPSGNQNMVVIVSEFFTNVQVTARDLSDFTLNTQSFDLDSFKIYPNPTATGFVNITSTNADAMSVVVYDILGKQIINESLTNNRLNVSALNTGIYVLKISQNNATVTKKLVIK